LRPIAQATDAPLLPHHPAAANAFFAAETSLSVNTMSALVMDAKNMMDFAKFRGTLTRLP